jgi:hypothetical protein
VTHGVVEQLEPVEVEEHQGNLLARRPRFEQHACEMVFGGKPVGQLGEWVVSRLISEVGF